MTKQDEQLLKEIMQKELFISFVSNFPAFLDKYIQENTKKNNKEINTENRVFGKYY